MRFRTIKLSLLASFLCCLPVFSWAQLSKSALTIYEAHQDAVVVITVAGSIEFTTDKGSLPDQEYTFQTVGTIIHPKGLIMVANSAIDSSIGKVGLRGRSAKAEDNEEFVTVTRARARFREIQVNMSDGSEYHATRVDHKEEKDVAFLMIGAKHIQERKTPLPFVNIDYRVSEGGLRIADDLVALTRSNAVFAYIPTIHTARVSGISKKESATYYLPTPPMSHGVPIFAKDGKFVGLTVERIVGGQRTNVRAILASGQVKALADLAKAKRGLK